VETKPERPERLPVVVHDSGPLSALLDTAKFEQLQRVAKLFASSTMVPDACRGNLANCFVLLQLADRLGIDPFMLMQSCYVVHGRPGIEAKMAITLCNERGPFSDRIKFVLQGEGMNRRCTAYAHDKTTGDRMEQTVTMAMAKAEGWYDRKDKNGNFCSKWRTLPDLMLQYRAAMFLIRLTCPEVVMGLHSREELEDIIDVPSRPASPWADAGPTLAKLESRLHARPNGPAANGGHQTVEDAAGAEVGAGPNGTTPEVGEEVAEEALDCQACGRLLSPGEVCDCKAAPEPAEPDPVIVGQYADLLAAAAKLSDVNALLAQAAGCDTPTRIAVEKLAAEARERIHAKRGTRTNRGLLEE